MAETSAAARIRSPAVTPVSSQPGRLSMDPIPVPRAMATSPSARRRGVSRAPLTAELRSGSLARQVQEWERHNGGGDAATTALDSPLHRELRARSIVGGGHRGEADGLLQD